MNSIKTDTQAHLCGGYFIAQLYPWPPSRGSLLSGKVLSASHCLCPIIPDGWCWAGNATQTEIQAGSARFGIPPERIDALRGYVEEELNADRFGVHNVFFSLDEAQAFASRFLEGCPDLVLYSIALHPRHLTEFEELLKECEDPRTFGIQKMVLDHIPPATSGRALGYEVLGYDYCGGFCSWLCNQLETKVQQRFGIVPSATGFIDRLDDANTVMEFCVSDEIQAEPGLWLPWLITDYPLLP